MIHADELRIGCLGLLFSVAVGLVFHCPFECAVSYTVCLVLTVMLGDVTRR